MATPQRGKEHVRLLPEVLPRLKHIKVYDRFENVAEGLVRDLQPLRPKVELVKCKTSLAGYFTV